MGTVFLTAVVWPTDTGGIIVWQIARIHLEGLTFFGHFIEWPSINRIGSLISRGITLYLENRSCHKGA